MIPLPVVLLVALLIIGLLYYQFFEKPTKEIKDRMRSLHFDEDKFILDMRTATFEHYDARLSRVVLIMVVLLSIAIAAPASIMPFPISFLTSCFGSIVALFGIILYNKDLKEKEFKDASDKEFGYALAWHPNYGFLPLLLRRMEFKNEVVLEEPQRELIVKRAIKTIKEMPQFKDSGIKEEEIKKAIESRIGEAKKYRLRIGAHYRVLLITDTDYEHLKTSEKHTIIDRTIEVKVPLIPSFMAFAGTTDRTFKTKSKDGEIEYSDRTMGIYVDLINLKDMKDKLLKGSFTAPDALTALVGQLVHLYEQQQWTSTQMTKETRKREKAELVARTQKFNAQSEANKIVNTTEHILKLLLSLLRPAAKRAADDYGLLFLVFAFGMATMKALDYIIAMATGGIS